MMTTLNLGVVFITIWNFTHVTGKQVKNSRSYAGIEFLIKKTHYLSSNCNMATATFGNKTTPWSTEVRY